MELNEEQKARAQVIADTVGPDPGKFFAEALKEEIKKANEKFMALLANAKLKLGEKYSKVQVQSEQAEAEFAVVQEAYRIWYEKNGKGIVAEKKAEIAGLFDDAAFKFDTLWTVLKKDAKEIVEIFKKNDEDPEK